VTYKVGQNVTITDGVVYREAEVIAASNLSLVVWTALNEATIRMRWNDESRTFDRHDGWRVLKDPEPEPVPLRDRVLTALLDKLEHQVQRYSGYSRTEDEAIDAVLDRMVECFERAENERMREE